MPRNLELRVSTSPARPGRAIDIGAELRPEPHDGRRVPVRWNAGGNAVHRCIFGHAEQDLAPNTVNRLRQVVDCRNMDAGVPAHQETADEGAYPCSAWCTTTLNEVLTTFRTSTLLDTTPSSPPWSGS